MKNQALAFAVLLLCSVGHAESIPTPMVLDEVEFQVSAKQWVSTQTALLNVTINATLTDSDLVKTRAEIMEKLNKIAQGDWHLIQFDRSQDSSGLEKLFVQAQARVNQASLTAIYVNAKTASKPGITYEINGIEFKPSLEEIQQAKATLRQNLYQQAQDELKHLNTVYTNQQYTVNRLMLVDGEAPVIQAKRMHANDEMLVGMAMPMAAPAPVTVSNEIMMTAIVKAASTRKAVG